MLVNCVDNFFQNYFSTLFPSSLITLLILFLPFILLIFNILSRIFITSIWLYQQSPSIVFNISTP